MNRKPLLYLFFIDFLLELLSTTNNLNSLGQFSKPLLMPALAVWFLFSSYGFSTTRYYILFALLFSWLGDLLLMMEDKNPVYFIAGLVSFLIAHIIYIFFFLSIRKTEKIKKPWNIFRIAAVALYTTAFYFLLYSHLSDLKIPVLVYAIIISVMLITAMHTSFKPLRTAQWWLIGAALFVTSDSLLAYNKFYEHFPLAGFFIMLTYGLAQFAIVNGSLQYLAAVKATPVNVQSNT